MDETPTNSRLQNYAEFTYPEPPRDVIATQDDQLLAETVYRHIWQQSQLTRLGQKLCSELVIKPESLPLKRVQDFEQQNVPPEVVQLHFKHYTNRRVKNLLRIGKHWRDRY